MRWGLRWCGLWCVRHGSSSPNRSIARSAWLSACSRRPARALTVEVGRQVAHQEVVRERPSQLPQWTVEPPIGGLGDDGEEHVVLTREPVHNPCSVRKLLGRHPRHGRGYADREPRRIEQQRGGVRRAEVVVEYARVDRNPGCVAARADTIAKASGSRTHRLMMSSTACGSAATPRHNASAARSSRCRYARSSSVPAAPTRVRNRAASKDPSDIRRT